jgi:uncharacterized protein involved in outer membrane biogenesis
MKIKRIAIWSSVVFVALLAIALTWLWTADLGVFKPQLERWVSEATGREFVIDGEFQVDLARHAVVIAEDVRFQNADWDDEPYMVEVGRVEIRVDLRSIFNGPFLVELIDIDDTEIRLVQAEDGEPNWKLPLARRSEATAEDDSSAGFDVLFDVVDIDRLHLVVEALELQEPLDLRVESLDQRRRDDNFLELNLQAMLGNREVSVEGELGTWAALRAGQDIHFSLQGQLDTFKIEASGLIDDVARPYRPAFQFSASSPDIGDLTRMLGLGEDAAGDIDLSGSLVPQVDGPLVLNVEGNIGATEIEAAGEFSDLQDFEQMDFDLLASGPDLGRVLRLAGIDQVRKAPFMIDIDATRQGPMLMVERGHMVFADAEFDFSMRLPDFPSVDDGRIAIKIKGPDIERFRYITGLPGSANGAFSIEFELRDTPSGREILELDLATSLGQVTANGLLGDAPRYIGSTLGFQLKSPSLARLGSAYGLDNLPDNPISMQGNVALEDEGVRSTGPLTVIVDEVSASVTGLIVLRNGIVGSDLSFDLAGPSLTAVAGAFGVAEGVPAEAFDVTGALQVGKDGYRFTDVKGILGSSNLNFDGLITNVEGLTGSRATFTLKGPAFEEVIDQIGDLEVRPGPYELSGTIALRNDRIRFEDISLDRENGQALVNFELGLPVSRRWANFDMSARGANIQSVLRGNNRYEAEAAPFLVDVHVELRETILSFDKFEIGIADARVQASGDLDFIDGSSSTEFSFTGEIPSLARLGRFDGRRFRDQGIKWGANIVGGGGALTIDDLNVTLGESDVHGFVRYTKGDVPKLEIDIDSESILFGALLEEEELSSDAEREFDDGRLIPDMPVPFDALKQLNATVDIDIGSFISGNLHMRNINVAVELQDGVIDVHNASFDGLSGWLKARAKLEPADGAGKASLELVARNFAPGALELNLDAAATGDLDISLESSGVDTRTLAGNLNGVLFADMRGGQITNSRAFSVIYGDMLTEILSAINPFYKSDPKTKFNCIVLPIEVVDGNLSSAPNSFVSTDHIRLTSKSAINLKTEKIDMNFRTTPQRGLTISGGEIFNPYIKIVGTLASPKLAIDETGVLVSGGAAVATGGLSILAKATWDRVSRSRDPCNETAQKGREALGDRFPNIRPASAAVPVGAEPDL